MIPYHVLRNVQGLGDTALQRAMKEQAERRVAREKAERERRERRALERARQEDEVKATYVAEKPYRPPGTTVERPVPDKTPRAEPIQQPEKSYEEWLKDWKAGQAKEAGSVTSSNKTAGTETVQSPDEAAPGAYKPVTEKKGDVNPLLLAGGAVAAIGALFMLKK